MTTKEQVLRVLNSNIGSFISGQEIAAEIYVTRAAVWKAIKALEKDGHDIEAITNKGYRLKNPVDLFDADYVKKHISKSWKNIKVIYYDVLDSTNDEAKRLALTTKNDLIIVAGKQTAGHGRRGRNFYSPENSGLYFSILLRNNNIPGSIAGITAFAATSVSTAIDEVIFNGKDTTKIKWVNDIFYNNKKVCGILSESCNYMEDEDSNYIIIGIGINVYEPESSFPKELKKTAGALITGSQILESHTDNNSIKNKLITKIVNNLLLYASNKTESLKIYRSKSTLIGNYIKINNFVNKTSSKSYAKVLGINSKYHLLIEYDNGDKDELSSGEVSVVKY